MEFSLAYRTDRRATRHAVKLDCHVVAEQGFRPIRGQTLDVSAQGIRIATETEVAVGETVVLAMRLPHGRHWVDAHGRVTRVERGVRQGDPGRAVAIEFTAMEPADRAMLVGAVERLPPPVPRRVLRHDYAASVRQAHVGA